MPRLYDAFTTGIYDGHLKEKTINKKNTKINKEFILYFRPKRANNAAAKQWGGARSARPAGARVLPRMATYSRPSRRPSRPSVVHVNYNFTIVF